MKFNNSLINTGIGAALGFATGGTASAALLGAGVGGLAGFQQDANNAEAQKAANKANAMNLAYWNMQNEYNSPVAQMARLKEAGLNPMLVYGSGNVTGNSSTSIGSPQTYANKANTMASVQGIQALANLKATGAQTASTQANTLATYQDIQNMQTANKIQQAQLDQELQNVELGSLDLEVARAIQDVRVQNAKDLVKSESGRLQHEKFKNSGTFMGNVAKFLGGTSASVGSALDVVGRVTKHDPVYIRSYNPTYNTRR